MFLRRAAFFLILIQSFLPLIATAQEHLKPEIESTQRTVEEETYERSEEQKHLGEEQIWQSKRTPGADVYSLRLKAFRQVAAMRNAAHANAATSPTWTALGPLVDNFFGIPSSGATSQLAVDPSDSSTVYSGFAGGGVWKSTDSGKTWNSTTDTQPFLDSLSFTMDPNNSKILYTGAAGGYGGGILKSIDAGSTWTNITGPFVGPFSSNSFFGGGARINQIAVKKGDSNTVLAAVFLGDSSKEGVYRSTDAGQTWTNVLSQEQTANSVVFDPQTTNVAYAALCNGYGSQGGFYKSTDSGLTWSILSGGLPSPTSIGGYTCFLDISPSNPSNLVVEINSPSGPTVYTSADSGQTWARQTNPPDNPHAGGVFFGATSPSIIFIGSADLFRSVDGGKTWTSQGSYAHSVHPDIDGHAYVGQTNAMYLGTDGGVYYTPDITTTTISWTNLSGGTPTLRVYPGMSQHPTDSTILFGGTQDEGTMRYSGTSTWATPACGDGGSTAIHQQNPKIVYLNCYLSDVEKSTDGGQSFQSAVNGINSSDSMRFFPPLTADPSNGDTVYFGTDRIYQSTDAGETWTPISAISDQLVAIAVSPVDSNVVYATATNGVFVSKNVKQGTASTWTKYSTGLPPRDITRVIADPNKSTTAYVTVSGFSGFGDSLGHVFKTVDGGVNWLDISGALPNIPADDLAVDPDIANNLYLATDAGVFATVDGGANWLPYGTGLPNAIETGINFFRPSRLVRVSTFGRGVFSITAPAPALTVSSTGLTFSAQAINSSSAAQTITVSNNLTSGSISITSITASGNFAEANTCGSSVAAGGTCTISVTFTPLSIASLQGVIAISTDHGNLSVTLSGIGVGVPQLTLSTSALTFSNQPVGISSTSQALSVANAGTAVLSGLAITLSGANAASFTLTTTCGANLAAGANCSANVVYLPTATGTSTATLSVVNSSSLPPQSVALAGTAVAPYSITSSTASASVAAGSAASYSIQIATPAGYPLASTVQLSCSGLPALATCTFSPTTITQGSTAQTVAMSIQTTAATLSAQDEKAPFRRTDVTYASFVAGALLLCFTRRRAIPSLFVILLVFGVIASMIGCSSNGGSTKSGGAPGTPAGTYTITVAAQSPSYQASEPLTLIVQ